MLKLNEDFGYNITILIITEAWDNFLFIPGELINDHDSRSGII
jgi:hypothetical protein